ncbi:Nuclear control of ATPase protein 2 [Dinochytrium kinnereticum]|nr:Nuclear control of ATPase protein 2 [Dinochytrium kinnereticum]
MAHRNDPEDLLLELAECASGAFHPSAAPSALVTPPQTTTTVGKSIALLAAIQDTRPPPPISSVVHSRATSTAQLLVLEKHLQIVGEYLEKEEPDHGSSVIECGERFFLDRALEVINYHLVSFLLSSAIAGSPSIRYWKDTESTPWKVLLNAVEESPFRLAKGVWESIQDGSFQTASTHLRRSVTDVGIGIASALIKPPTFLDAARRRILRKLRGLEVLRLEHASLVGILCERFAPSKTGAEVKITGMNLDVSLVAMETVLKKLATPSVYLEKDSMQKVYQAILIETDAINETIDRSATDSVTHRELYHRARQCLHIVKHLPITLYQSQQSFSPPPLLQRAWLPAAATLIAYFFAKRSITFTDIKNLYLGAVETAYNFAAEWVVRPIREIFETIRHSERRLALMGSESLNSDLDSLQRMVVAFAKDHGAVGGSVESLVESVQRGDLTVVLERYEEEIKSPLTKALTGDLIRSLLIQVQKGKVDLELAMSALDKLLRANELNFAFLAVAPTLLLLYFSIIQIDSHLRRRRESGIMRGVDVIRSSLREIELILLKPSMDAMTAKIRPLESGLMMCEIANLHWIAAGMRRSKERSALLQDLEDLSNPESVVGRKMSAVQRMKDSLLFIALTERRDFCVARGNGEGLIPLKFNLTLTPAVFD